MTLILYIHLCVYIQIAVWVCVCQQYIHPTFHNIMCALADSAQTTDSTVDGGDDAVLSQEVTGELVRFVTCEEYT